MARTRTTIRRIDPWSVLKFGFVANLVLLGVQLLAGTVLWYVIRRLELIQTVCELAATIGFEECGVNGRALFDTFLVLGLLGVVIQTGILVFLTFLANLIFDLTGGIGITLEDDRGPARATRSMDARSLGVTGSGGPDSRATSTTSAKGATGATSAGDDRTAEQHPPTAPVSSSTRSGEGGDGDEERLFGSH